MYHELLVAGYSAHNVFSSGFGTDLTLDHHGGVPHNNLWTNIDLVRLVIRSTSKPACSGTQTVVQLTFTHKFQHKADAGSCLLVTCLYVRLAPASGVLPRILPPPLQGASYSALFAAQLPWR